MTLNFLVLSGEIQNQTNVHQQAPLFFDLVVVSSWSNFFRILHLYLFFMSLSWIVWLHMIFFFRLHGMCFLWLHMVFFFCFFEVICVFIRLISFCWHVGFRNSAIIIVNSAIIIYDLSSFMLAQFFSSDRILQLILFFIGYTLRWLYLSISILRGSSMINFFLIGARYFDFSFCFLLSYGHIHLNLLWWLIILLSFYRLVVHHFPNHILFRGRVVKMRW